MRKKGVLCCFITIVVLVFIALMIFFFFPRMPEIVVSSPFTKPSSPLLISNNMTLFGILAMNDSSAPVTIKAPFYVNVTTFSPNYIGVQLSFEFKGWLVQNDKILPYLEIAGTADSVYFAMRTTTVFEYVYKSNFSHY
jgi:hypothetical protein